MWFTVSSLSIFTNPSGRAGYDIISIFKLSLTGFNSEFSFSLTSCFTKAEEPSLPYYLPIAGGRIIGFISFPWVLVLCEMQSGLSRIWTLVAVSISYDDNHYTTDTFSVLSLSPYNLHLLFICVKYFCFNIVILVMFFAAIRSDTVSLLMFPFLSYVLIFSCEIL